MIFLHHPIARVLSPVLLCTACAFGGAPPGVVIDGDVSEWPAETTLTDAAGDHNPVSIDIRGLTITHDADFVYFRLEVDRPVNLQHIPGSLHLLLDADGTAATGIAQHDTPGLDVGLQFPPPRVPGERLSGMGVGLFSTTDDARLSPYDADFMFAPTYASNIFEMRIARGITLRDRNETRLFTGEQFSGRLVLVNIAGTVLDASDRFSYDLTPVAPAPPVDQTDDPLAKDTDALRIVAWNAEFSTILDKPEPFARVLRALDPDVILWQELSNKTSSADLQRWSAAYLGDDAAWNAMVGRGGGNLRCGIVSRHPIADIKPLDYLPYPNAPDRTLRIAGAVATINDRRLILVSAHFKCCGALDTKEDDKRNLEANRLNTALKRATRRRGIAPGIDGIIVGGDLNLVGGYEPLERLVKNIDLDDTDLLITNPMQLDQRSNITWRGNAGKSFGRPDRFGPFAPGRLDFITLSDATLDVYRAFVFDAQDLTPEWREHHGVILTDTDQASDHLPVVVDVRWKAAEQLD